MRDIQKSAARETSSQAAIKYFGRDIYISILHRHLVVLFPLSLLVIMLKMVLRDLTIFLPQVQTSFQPLCVMTPHQLTHEHYSFSLEGPLWFVEHKLASKSNKFTMLL